MMVSARLLQHDGLEVVSLIAVVVEIFDGIAQLLFKPGDALRCLPLFLFSSSAESRRSPRIALPLLVGHFGRRLDFYRNLQRLAILALDCHDLVCARVWA
jgi:hypothetical protein